MRGVATLFLVLMTASAFAGYGNFPASGGGGSGTVTGVTGTAPIVSSGGTAPIISCIVATGSVAGCLSAADWTTFNAKQSALTFSAPLVNTTGTISCTAASGSVNGCLSSTDWTTFNGKQATGLTVLKAGDTMTGDLILTTAANGVTIGAAATKSKSLYIKPGASGTGIQIENSNNTRKFNIDVNTAGFTLFGMDATNGMMAVSNVASGGTGVNWTSFGGNGTANPPAWPMAFETISADGNVTLLSDFTPLKGATVNGLPIVVQRNRNSTVNTLAEWGNTGSSGNLIGGWGTRAVVQTASSEQGQFYAFNNQSGTQVESFQIAQNGNVSFKGTAPTVGTCGTSPTIVGNNNAFRITIGTGGTANACTVTFATTPAWDNAPICQCSDETTALHMEPQPTTTVVVINSFGLTTGTAAAYGASDKVTCLCHGYR